MPATTQQCSDINTAPVRRYPVACQNVSAFGGIAEVSRAPHFYSRARAQPARVVSTASPGSNSIGIRTSRARPRRPRKVPMISACRRPTKIIEKSAFDYPAAVSVRSERFCPRTVLSRIFAPGTGSATRDEQRPLSAAPNASARLARSLRAFKGNAAHAGLTPAPVTCVQTA